ncbi:MAG: putative pyridoxal-dependent aspartate 1-decarboxylase, partial [Microcoleus sp. SIO2G3]|nr:putative pyridoxal-dependent aspartate 1-decarboxylase [Microcoleus sp. SIO2G3]
MTLSKQEMPNQNYFLETEQTLYYNIEEQVMQLFGASSQATSLEKEIDEIINDFSQAFLSTFDANTNIDLDYLLEKFSD